MIPGAVAVDPHVRMAAPIGVPTIDGRKLALVEQLLELGDADALKVDWGTRLGHSAH